MSDNRETTLKERLKARRLKLQEGTSALSEEDSPRKPDSTWDAAMEEEESKSGYASLEMEEEVKESEQLVKSLKKKRKKVKQELDDTVRAQEKREDISAELRKAKQKTKKKVKDAEERSATEAEETAASSEELLLESDRSKGGTTPSRGPTPREDTVVKATSSDELMRESRDTAPLIDTTKDQAKKVDDSKKKKMSLTMGQSYREKLALKMKVAKDKGKDEAYGGGARLLKDRGKDVPTRFDAPDKMRKEDIELEESLQKSLTARAKFKEALQQEKADYYPSPEESYEFFTRQWEADPEQDRLDEEKRLENLRKRREKERQDVEKESEREEDEEGDEPRPDEPKEEDEADDAELGGKKAEEKPLLDVEDRMADAWQYYAMGAADYIGFREVMLREEKAYYFPSIIPTPLAKKVHDEEAAPRFLEEEGLYVGQRPHVLNKSLYKMENRLIKEGDQSADWFGEDGVLLALPDPLKENPSRPFIPETITEPALQTEFKQAYLNEFDSRFIDGSVEAKGQYMLAIDVNSVQFHHHHLFSREHVLAARISRSYEDYLLRSKKKTVEYLGEKLKALKSAAAHVMDNIAKMESERGERRNKVGIADQKNRLKEYTYEIKQTRKQRDIEMRADRELIKNIIQTWKDIKSLRQFQRCTNTSVKLLIRKESANAVEDEKEWQHDIEDELLEAKQDEEEQHEKNMSKYRQDMEKYKQQRQAKVRAARQLDS